jgi:hypothetical protein
MSRLKVMRKATDDYGVGHPAEIGVRPDGELEIVCADDWTYDWLTSLIVDQLFVPGKGFPVFQRDAGGKLAADPDTHRYILAGFVTLDQSEADVLSAIVDNFEAAETFDISWID